jgi:hypothetical protein
MMRRAMAVALGVAFASACMAAAPAQKPRGEPAKSEPLAVPRVVPLKNAGFENAPRSGERCPEHWGCSMHADPDSFRFSLERSAPAEGKQSLCIERVTNEPWSLATQALDAVALRGAKLRFSLAVRVDRAEGPGAGPFLIVHGPTGNLAHEERLVTRTDGWQRIAVDFTVAPAAQMVEVGATLQGDGRACVDDARLEFIPPPKQ